MVDKYRVSVIGADSFVGQELVSILEERQFPVADLNLYVTEGLGERSVVGIRHSYPVQPLGHDNEREAFLSTDIAFFTGDDSTSRHYVPRAVQAGVTVIDSSAIFRFESGVPLVIPEVNLDDAEWHEGIIASPNCSATLLNMVLSPLHKANPVRKVVLSTYQSTSGMGLEAVNEFTAQTQQMLAGVRSRPNIFPHEIGFNVLPQVDVFMDNGYTKEEWQLLEETRRILHNNDILVSATCVRVPTFKGHCQATTIEFKNEINPEIAGDILAKSPGIRVVDDPSISLYPHPRMAAGTDYVMVGRVRQDMLNLNGLALWIVADNIRKGAALNMVQIAEEIYKKGWLKAKSQR